MASLANVVLDLCKRAGLPPEAVDVSVLTGTCDGLVISNVASVRSTLEHLVRANFLDVIESGGVIVFRPRGSAPLATIGVDELVSIGDQGVETLTLVRRQESELSKAINVVFINKNASYEQGSQAARRQISPEGEVSNITIPLVMDGAKAKAIAEAMLAAEWAERTQFRFVLPTRYARLQPGDVVDLVDGDVTYQVRLYRTGWDDGRLACEGYATDATVYTQSAPPGDDTRPDETVPEIGPTVLHLLDIPILSDRDDDAGFYVAVSQTPDTVWNGAVLYRSANGADYGALLTMGLSATAGTAETALPAGPTAFFDRGNAVDIALTDGALLSAPEADVLNGANGALLGDEIIQWTTATLIGTKRYRLSGFLRGRLGTEYAIYDHSVGERFVVLQPVGTTLERVRDSVDLLLAPRWYKGVTIGEKISDVDAVTFINVGRGLRPYAPCHLRGQRDADGTLELRWIRRARFGGLWRDGGDVPLGEAIERYDIEVIDGNGAVVRQATVTTPAWTYSAADQIADFGLTPVTITVRVFQISAVTGRGTPLEGTL
ncbi:MAG: phage tail protein [Defluviicoccus sp.]